MKRMERFETWPDLRVGLHLLPWAWALGWWHDAGMTSSFTLNVGPLKIEWWANRPLFREKATSPVGDAR